MRTIVRAKNDISQERHWAILKFNTIHIPGDERSRTNPGHGYPASSESIVVYELYTTKQEWEAMIRVLEERHETNYCAVEVNPAKVTVQTIVEVE